MVLCSDGFAVCYLEDLCTECRRLRHGKGVIIRLQYSPLVGEKDINQPVLNHRLPLPEPQRPFHSPRDILEVTLRGGSTNLDTSPKASESCTVAVMGKQVNAMHADLPGGLGRCIGNKENECYQTPDTTPSSPLSNTSIT